MVIIEWIKNEYQSDPYIGVPSTIKHRVSETNCQDFNFFLVWTSQGKKKFHLSTDFPKFKVINNETKAFKMFGHKID